MSETHTAKGVTAGRRIDNQFATIVATVSRLVRGRYAFVESSFKHTRHLASVNDALYNVLYRQYNRPYGYP